MKTVLIEKTNTIYTITLNRPELRNAFNQEMIGEMTQVFKSLHTDQNVRVVILKGAGESFCGGGDLSWMRSMVEFSRAENIKDAELLYEMFLALQKIPVPVLCLVHGHAMGGGLGLIAASDIAIAVKDTEFCFSEVRLGLAPAVISSFVSKKVQSADLIRYFLTAEVFAPKQAQKMGLIHDFAPKKKAAEMVKKLASKIILNGPLAVRSTKKLLTDLETTPDPRKLTTELIATLRVNDEGQEGLKAFFAKRKPKWMEFNK